MGQQRKTMTHKELVLKNLRSRKMKGLSIGEAKAFGVDRLPARIFELKGMGYDIQRVDEVVDGKKSVRYVLAGEIDRG
jgi:hypothetical protein